MRIISQIRNILAILSGCAFMQIYDNFKGREARSLFVGRCLSKMSAFVLQLKPDKYRVEIYGSHWI